MFKCELLIGSGSRRYDVTNDLMNWDDFGISLKRPAYDGVMRSFSTQFEFVKKAYKLLDEAYHTYYLNASATVIFSLRNNNWEYDEVFRCALDFSTYSEDGLTASINAIDNTLAAIIKAKKNIQYEYPVSEFQTSRLEYDGVTFMSQITWIPNKEDSGDNQKEYIYTTNKYNYIPMALLNDSEGRTETEFAQYDNYSTKDFVRFTATKTVKVALDFDFKTTGTSGDGVLLILWRTETNGMGLKNLRQWSANNNAGVEHVYLEENFTIDAGYGLALGITTVSGNNNTVYISNFNKCAILWDYKRAKPIDIDVIHPISVLSKLLGSMTEGTVEYVSSINYGLSGVMLERLSTAYIMAAESARGLPNAKLYTSYKKFCDWMEAEFGYVPIIKNGFIVRFIHRDKLFTSTLVKKLEKNINNYELKVNDSLIYSSVKVGYDKQDYDSINGRDEFRFTSEFSTGLQLVDNTLSLISPYRADAYGIEFLVQKRGEDTTDSDSDNDVFFVSCQSNGNYLTLYRPYSASQLSGLLSPETMFNIQYSPRFMLEANKQYIGTCASTLKFASSDGNSDVSIDGVKETDDFQIPERLFSVSEVEVSTSDLTIPDDLNGLVSFTYKKKTITGYIKQIKLYIGKEKAATYTLIVKNVRI